MTILQTLFSRLLGRKPYEAVALLGPPPRPCTRVENGRVYHRIEFIGGPLDGHQGWMAEEELPQCAVRVGIKISQTLFDCLHNGESFRDETPTSMAVYRRCPRRANVRYEFREHRSVNKPGRGITPLFLRS